MAADLHSNIIFICWKVAFIFLAAYHKLTRLLRMSLDLHELSEYDMKEIIVNFSIWPKNSNGASKRIITISADWLNGIHVGMIAILIPSVIMMVCRCSCIQSQMTFKLQEPQLVMSCIWLHVRKSTETSCTVSYKCWRLSVAYKYTIHAFIDDTEIDSHFHRYSCFCLLSDFTFNLSNYGL